MKTIILITLQKIHEGGLKDMLRLEKWDCGSRGETRAIRFEPNLLTVLLSTNEGRYRKELFRVVHLISPEVCVGGVVLGEAGRA